MKNIQAIVPIWLFVCAAIFQPCLAIRARKKARRVPTIETYWKNGKKKRYRLSNSHLGPYPTFGLKLSSFESYKIPQQGITFGPNNREILSSDALDALIAKTLTEVEQRKKRFTHATVLQNKNFNRKKGCGLLVLKLNDYPFVVKLFKETPETLINPYCKGIEPICFFYMGNGSNRHLAGLTRLKNRDLVARKLNKLPAWKDTVEVPRKWLWTPKKQDTIAIEGYNFGPEKKMLSTELPGTYAIIADAIAPSNEHSLSVAKKKEMAMKLCNDLDNLIDPHFKNFIFRKEPDDKLKIVIIDTEHFPTMVGLSEKRAFQNHNEYYMYLVNKCFHDSYLQNRVDDVAAKRQQELFLNELLEEHLI